MRPTSVLGVERQDAAENPSRRRRILLLVWVLAVIAVLPAVFWRPVPPPLTGAASNIAIGAAYLLALGICYWIYRSESGRVSRSQAFVLAFLVFLLTSITNILHNFNVDRASNYFTRLSNTGWQEAIQNLVLLHSPSIVPHSYRFLPNSIVRWMELGGIGYETGRDIYRLIFGLLLYYAIYRYARLYTSYSGAILSMLLVAVVFPVSFELYAGQLTDPLSHLSFVLALIFLETEDFAFLFTTLIVGSLAKETVLAMAGYYLLFHRREKNYPLKAATLSIGAVVAYAGVRLVVVKGPLGYSQISDVTVEHIWSNASWRSEVWGTDIWLPLFLLTACAFLPFLALGWKETPVSLKRQIFFLLPVLFVSSLAFSWLHETRNYMPIVFVAAVIAARYLTRHATERPGESGAARQA